MAVDLNVCTTCGRETEDLDFYKVQKGEGAGRTYRSLRLCTTCRKPLAKLLEQAGASPRRAPMVLESVNDLIPTPQLRRQRVR